MEVPSTGKLSKADSEDVINLDESSINYDINVKTQKDILSDLRFKDEDDELICHSIIDNLEKFASENIRKLNTVQLPFIGCIRIDPVKYKFKHKKLHLSTIRHNTTKEEYREYVKDTYNEFIKEAKEEDKRKLYLTKIKRNNKDKYETLYKNLGKAYANMFIYSITLFEEIPFDADWEYHYQSLKE